MLGRQAKTLSPGALARMLAAVRSRPTSKRDRVMILLSARAGLRACEIARLTWAMALDANGRIGPMLEVRSVIAKYRSGRRIPIHGDLRVALQRLHAAHGDKGPATDQPIVQSARGGALRPNSIVNWFVALFHELELEGCSSHSGRRTFITNAARSAHKAGASLRDVQLLAGHRSIETTQGYIDGDTSAQRKLVSLI